MTDELTIIEEGEIEYEVPFPTAPSLMLLPSQGPALIDNSLLLTKPHFLL